LRGIGGDVDIYTEFSQKTDQSKLHGNEPRESDCSGKPAVSRRAFRLRSMTVAGVARIWNEKRGIFSILYRKNICPRFLFLCKCCVCIYELAAILRNNNKK
jgi:hypothetical protein